MPGIIEFVNATFAGLMGDRFAPLQVDRESTGASSPVRIVGGALENVSAAERRRAEGDAVADVVLSAIGDPGWIVADESDGALRSARLADIAILLPSRTGLDILEDALDERHIGYRVESVSLVYDSQEVRDLLALARAIDDPGNETALAAALRSPAFGCGDDDLLEFRRAGGSFSLAAVIPEAVEASVPVAAAIRALRELRGMRHSLGPVGVLVQAATDRRLLQIAGAGPRARESWRRLRFVIEQARGFVEAGGGGLVEFAEWVDEQVAGNLAAIESTVPDDDEDAVRIMTIHGAKGLEFPVVILAGLGTERRGRRGGVSVLRDDQGRAEAQVVKDRCTSGYAHLAAEERLLGIEEDLRLLYVAATRARDHLVICGHHTPTGGGEVSLAERLLAAAELAAAEGRPQAERPQAAQT